MDSNDWQDYATKSDFVDQIELNDQISWIFGYNL